MRSISDDIEVFADLAMTLSKLIDETYYGHIYRAIDEHCIWGDDYLPKYWSYNE